ncbi:MAG: LPXTG cell wall anchor domain-containing protein [Clostridia bacterium]|nr:LPXTG cell wall anchor domain-containing protein [Clostridia bacterium]
MQKLGSPKTGDSSTPILFFGLTLLSAMHLRGY